LESISSHIRALLASNERRDALGQEAKRFAADFVYTKAFQAYVKTGRCGAGRGELDSIVGNLYLELLPRALERRNVAFLRWLAEKIDIKEAPSRDLSRISKWRLLMVIGERRRVEEEVARYIVGCGICYSPRRLGQLRRDLWDLFWAKD